MQISKIGKGFDGSSRLVNGMKLMCLGRSWSSPKGIFINWSNRCDQLISSAGTGSTSWGKDLPIILEELWSEKEHLFMKHNIYRYEYLYTLNIIEFISLYTVGQPRKTQMWALGSNFFR